MEIKWFSFWLSGNKKSSRVSAGRSDVDLLKTLTCWAESRFMFSDIKSSCVSNKKIKLPLSSVCLQGAWPRSPLCSRSPRRPSCGRPCWRRPPGIRRRRTGCRLEEGTDSEWTSGEKTPGKKLRNVRSWTSTLTERLAVLVVASEEVISDQTADAVKQEETDFPNKRRDFLTKENQRVRDLS